MYVVTNVYDDKTLDIMDLHEKIEYNKTEKEISEMIKSGARIKGVFTYENNIYTESYDVIEFSTYDEAYEFVSEHTEEKYKIESLDEEPRDVYVLLKKNSIRHVDYYVRYWLGDEVHYTTQDKSRTTQYIDGASVYNKEEAYRLVESLNKHTRTGKYWEVFTRHF